MTLARKDHRRPTTTIGDQIRFVPNRNRQRLATYRRDEIIRRLIWVKNIQSQVVNLISVSETQR